MDDTRGAAYAEHLEQFDRGWRRLLDVQRPYRWNVRRLGLGFVLDVGCGVGRNLKHLGSAAGVGVDHSANAVAKARSRGLTAFTPEEFRSSSYARAGAFDSLLLAHVLEHMSFTSAVELVKENLPFVRPGGKAVFIVPQAAGYRRDPTHVEYFDGAKLAAVAHACGLEPEKPFSFPFPAAVGRVFPYNETVLISRVK
jgi:SAM-dependent methyltransferase